MDLYTTYYDSPLGILRLQCSDKFLTTLSFEEEKLLPVKNHKLLQSCSQQLDEYFSGKGKTFSLPLNQDGTEFQQKVWGLLCNISYGRTVSYQELSRQYGNMKAIRAVASANGKNNIAIIVPCHRVIGSDHSLTGYAGGLWRKQWLLEHEAKYHHGVHQLQLIAS
jgi:methylated-DNA-[protein]-cysteine S-methyltransferase